MKKLIVPVLALLFTAEASSQDLLTMRSGSKYEVKLLEINDHELKFKMYNNQEGPLYVISRNSLASVCYANGTIEVLALEKSDQPQTVSINGFNTASSEPAQVSPDQSATAGAGTDYAGTGTKTAMRKKTTFGEVLGAIVVTGMMALDVAAKIDEDKKCSQRHTHSHCCRK